MKKASSVDKYPIVGHNILVVVLAMALGGIISWTYFGIFAAGWLTGLAISYCLRTS